MKNVLLATMVTAAALASSLQVQAQSPEINASVSASNFYLWRGLDQSDGNAQVAGSLIASSNGGYVGTWVGSGDRVNGTEADFFVGYANKVGDFSYDVQYITVLFPEKKLDFGEIAEAVIGLGYGPATFTYIHNLGKDVKDKEWNYMSLGLKQDKFGLLLGKHHYQQYTNAAGNVKTVKGMYHADLSYMHNKHVTFTVSQPFKANDNVDVGRTKFNVNLALPVKF